MKQEKKVNFKKRGISGVLLCFVLLGTLFYGGTAQAEEAEPDFEQPQRILFTPEEAAYIAEHPQVEVTLLDDVPLICEYNEENGQFEGIMVDILNDLSERTSLEFVYQRFPENMSVGSYLEENPDVLLTPFYKNNMLNYGTGLNILDSVVRSRMMAVGREGKTLDFRGELLITVPEEMCNAADKIQELFPNAKLIPCASHKDGLDMVKNGEADITLVNEISGMYMLQSPYYERLITTEINSLLEDITFAAGMDMNPLLVSVINKGIASLDERDVREIVLSNTVNHVYDLTLSEWLYENGAMFLLFVLTFGGFAVVITKSRKREKEREQELRIAEERRIADEVYQSKLFRQANYDELTGVYNKEYFIKKATELLEQNPDKVYSFFRVNFKDFKLINEMYGLKCGDCMLQKMGEVLRRDTGSVGVYGRLYSDHFIICYPVNRKQLHYIKNVPADYVEYMGQMIRVQPVVGVYVNEQKSTDVRQLLDYTQIALQEGKKANSNTHIHFYEDSYMERLLRNQQITNEMEQALADGQFHVFLQPQFDQMTKALVGAEALVRWFHPEEGMISPGEFIPVFESNRFICKLDEYICEEVCRLLHHWKEKGKLVPVSINVSRVNIENQGFLPMLLAAMERYEIPAEYLHLEITESAYVENPDGLLELVKKMKEAGFVVEMDDFGSGYSSFNTFKDLPVDIIKLDMKFFSGETHMDKGGRIIESIVKMAHSMGMFVIAEGVETEREANFLKSLGCRIVQGYLYGKPVNQETFEQLLCDSEISEKTAGTSDGNQEQSRYWSMEKYNVLLHCTKAILFDYDPASDYGVFTYMGEKSGLTERPAEKLVEHISEMERIHPDYREPLGKILLDEEKTEEAEFLADYSNEGKYVWCSAAIYRYYKDEKLSRLIAIIKQK